MGKTLDKQHNESEDKFESEKGVMPVKVSESGEESILKILGLDKVAKNE